MSEGECRSDDGPSRGVLDIEADLFKSKREREGEGAVNRRVSGLLSSKRLATHISSSNGSLYLSVNFRLGKPCPRNSPPSSPSSFLTLTILRLVGKRSCFGDTGS